MVHYKKKRPVLKSSAEVYKKSKWMKFKEQTTLFFSNLKRFFAKIMLKIHEKGSQKLTIMVVPHNEKKIFNIQISNYILFFATVILTVTVVTSVITISSNQQNAKKLVSLSDENQSQILVIEGFKNSIQSLNNKFSKFKADVNQIFRAAGGESDIYQFNEIKIGSEYTNDTLPQEALSLEKLAMELELTKMKIGEMLMFKAQMGTLLSEIPSLYPLAARARITSPYGPRIDPVYRWKSSFHAGIDLAVDPGTPVFAAADGVIDTAGYHGGYGLLVKIKHKYGFETKYGHMLKLGEQITVGAQVKQGQIIGYVGSSGKATGPHLHYEVLIGGKTVNPEPFICMRPGN